MKKYIFLILLFSALLHSRSIKVTGNIDKVHYIDHPGNLNTLLAEEKIEADAVLVCGIDGISAFVTSPAFCQVEIQKENLRWLSVTDSLPPVCNIKNIEEIVIWRSGWERKLYIEKKQSFPQSFTPYHFILGGYKKVAESEKNGYKAIKYKRITNTLLQNLPEPVRLQFSDGDIMATSFQIDSFQFDGCEFLYQHKPLKKIMR
ncbi:MAG: hypothetical protein K9N06_10425 [Candidatus Cloacimonetes bacterium]|nr:hypothetical protein [Candidatus Cloacimonadota bacterium]